MQNEYVERLFKPRKRTPREGAGKLKGRETPLARDMVAGVPEDGVWYLAALCYSSGQATALASHVGRGGYGPGVEVRVGALGNRNKRSEREHHAVLINRRRRPHGAEE